MVLQDVVLDDLLYGPSTHRAHLSTPAQSLGTREAAHLMARRTMNKTGGLRPRQADHTWVLEGQAGGLGAH